MSTSHKYCNAAATLELDGESVTVHFWDGEEQEQLLIPRPLLDRSTVFRQALLNADNSGIGSFTVPHGFLKSWLQWRTHESS